MREEFDFPNLSCNQLAKALETTANRINELVVSRRGMKADTPLRLEKDGIGAARLWMSLQMNWELQTAKKKASEAIAMIKRCVA